MTRLLNLVGHRYGRLTVVSYLGQYKATPRSEPKSMWRCVCDCGNTTDVVRGSLRSGLTKSCGCWNSEVAGARLRTHGASATALYRTWAHMIGRCHDPNDRGYADYGGRGIKVCDEWRKDFMVFHAYVAEHMGPKPGQEYSIDRINNDGNYEPGNVRWATPKQQANNKRKPKYEPRTHCVHGHEMTPENTYQLDTPNGLHRSCRTCRQAAEERRKEKRRLNAIAA